MRKLVLATVAAAALGAATTSPAAAGVVHGTIAAFNPQTGYLVLDSGIDQHTYRLAPHVDIQPGALELGRQVMLRVDSWNGEQVSRVHLY